jgi:hypothetical protein
MNFPALCQAVAHELRAWVRRLASGSPPRQPSAIRARAAIPGAKK